jgi:hypothetical protein
MESVMESSSTQSALLRRGSLLRIDALTGYRIVCRRGMVWLTQEADPLDRILVAGESFAVTHPGIVLLNALAHDAVVACPPAARCTITRAAAGETSAHSLAAELGRLRPRYDTAALTMLAPGERRLVVEQNARRMRAQAQWLVVQHVRGAITRAFAALRRRLRDAFAQMPKSAGRRGRVNANG